MKSPTPTLPRRKGAAPKYRDDSLITQKNNLRALEYNPQNPICKVLCAIPSLWWRAGVGLLCLILYGCITDFEPKGIDEEGDILVVEGVITDDVTTITLTRSVHLTNYTSDESGPQYVLYAKVYVECDDGTQFQAEPLVVNGQYKIRTGILNLERKYCLKIEIKDTKTYVYATELSYPIQTPEIDSVFWTKRGKGQPVNIHVATHSPYEDILYYRWSYKEDWEYTAKYRYISFLGRCNWCGAQLAENEVFCNICGTKAVYPYYCWNMDTNSELLLGSAVKTVFGRLTDKIIEISPSSLKLSMLYRIDIKQNAISKQAYDYFINIKKNTETMGTIFAPIPSELRGNISCITDPDRPVIGFVEVSSSTHKRWYISNLENIYELPWSTCLILDQTDLCTYFSMPQQDCGRIIPLGWIIYTPASAGSPRTYTFESCVDCTVHGGNTEKPDDWPNDHKN